ncbi:hypothetical protein N9N67_08740 [Bacteriovoracaceae bacterium]|nr:hypothetical protein [Bacteriovoracaceae bacterium]
MKREKNLISQTKDNIYRLYPKINSLEVDMIKLKNENYRSRIILTIKKKSFFVEKEAQNYKESLDKSSHAIKEQLERAKIDRAPQPLLEVEFEDEVDKMYYNDIGGEG